MLYDQLAWDWNSLLNSQEVKDKLIKSENLVSKPSETTTLIVFHINIAYFTFELNAYTYNYNIQIK